MAFPFFIIVSTCCRLLSLCTVRVCWAPRRCTSWGEWLWLPLSSSSSSFFCRTPQGCPPRCPVSFQSQNPTLRVSSCFWSLLFASSFAHNTFDCRRNHHHRGNYCHGDSTVMVTSRYKTCNVSIVWPTKRDRTIAVDSAVVWPPPKGTQSVATDTVCGVGCSHPTEGQLLWCGWVAVIKCMQACVPHAIVIHMHYTIINLTIMHCHHTTHTS